MTKSPLRVALCATLALLLPAPASAHLTTHSDPDDTVGALDIRSSSFKHANGKFTLTLTTQGNWSVSELGEGKEGHNTFQFIMDSKGNANNDFYIAVDNYDGELQAKLVNSAFEFVQYLPAVKDGRTARTTFRKGKVDPRAAYVRWQAYSKTVRSPCTSICSDLVPDEGFYRHNL